MIKGKSASLADQGISPHFCENKIFMIISSWMWNSTGSQIKDQSAGLTSKSLSLMPHKNLMAATKSKTSLSATLLRSCLFFTVPNQIWLSLESICVCGCCGLHLKLSPSSPGDGATFIHVPAVYLRISHRQVNNEWMNLFLFSQPPEIPFRPTVPRPQSLWYLIVWWSFCSYPVLSKRCFVPNLKCYWKDFINIHLKCSSICSHTCTFTHITIYSFTLRIPDMNNIHVDFHLKPCVFFQIEFVFRRWWCLTCCWI